jgi:hypothetical protein
LVTQGEAVPSSHFTSRAQNDRKTASNKKPRVNQTARIRGQDVFRCFHEFKQLVIRNLGMTHRQGGGTRYSMLMGIDVSDGIDSLMRTERIQNNIFGSGFEDGEPRTLGCSIN